MKTEANGYPDWVRTPENEDRYIDNFYAREGMRLDKDATTPNGAKCGLAKLCLNSTWVKPTERNSNKIQDGGPKRLLFNMVKNTEFLGSVNRNPYFSRLYELSYLALNMNGKQIPKEVLSSGMHHEKTSVMGYRTLFETSGIHHSKSGLQITHKMYMNGYFMLLFDLTRD